MEPMLSSTSRRRGHQHHPRHAIRRRLNQNVHSTPSTLPTFSTITSSAPTSGPAQCGPAGVKNDAILTKDSIRSPVKTPNLQCNLRLNDNVRLSRHIPVIRQQINESQPSCDNNVIVIQNEKSVHCKQNNTVKNVINTKSYRTNLSDDTLNKSFELKHADARAQGDGHSDEEIVIVEEDAEISELAKLRCTSERIEVQAEREAKRRKHCADYPGLAFGRSIFSSDTMMKFSLIKNELQNIMSTQLKRVSIMA